MAVVLTLLVCGIILLTLETILPGLILGVIGIGCWVAAVFISYTQIDQMAGHLTLLGVLFLSTGGFILWLKFFPTSPMGKVFVSTSSVGELGPTNHELLGMTGLTMSRLAPSGFARIRDKKMDVIAAVGYIDPNTPVEVIEVSGNRIVVRKIDSPTQASSGV